MEVSHSQTEYTGVDKTHPSGTLRSQGVTESGKKGEEVRANTMEWVE